LLYSDAKEANGATALANELGQEATAERPCSIKAVFRSRFT
jgi:hypothetical protein